VRLHVWKGSQGSDSRHNHRWWFVSMPLIGRFVDVRYSDAQGSEFLRINVSDTDGRDSSREYRLEGSNSLSIRQRYIRYPFIPYFCKIGDIHSYYPLRSGLHASLVLSGPIRRDTSDIFRTPDGLDVRLEPPLGG
jgi:hypothetical protein